MCASVEMTDLGELIHGAARGNMDSMVRITNQMMVWIMLARQSLPWIEHVEMMKEVRMTIVDSLDFSL